MDIKFNPFSPVFWSSLAGIAGVVCATLGLGHLSTPVETALTAIGGVLVAIPAHHTVKAAVMSKAVTKASAASLESAANAVAAAAKAAQPYPGA